MRLRCCCCCYLLRFASLRWLTWEIERKNGAMEFLSFHLRFECQRWKKYFHFHFLCCRSHVSKEKRLLVCCGCCRCYSLNVIYWNKSALSHSSRHVIIIILLLLYYLNGVSISMLEQKLARLAQLNCVECGNETR